MWKTVDHDVFVVFVIKDVELIHVVLNPILFSQFLENADKIPNFKAMGYLPNTLKKNTAPIEGDNPITRCAHASI